MTGFPLSGPEPFEVVARTRDGDNRAFTALVSAYQPRVYRWALALTGDQDEAEDVTQEVFVRVYRKLGGFRGDGSLDAWIYRITRRIAFRARRPENHLKISIAADLNCRTKLMRGGAICNFSGKDCQDKNVSHAKFF